MIARATLALALTAAACDAQVAPDYAGEPLARIRGRTAGFEDDSVGNSATVLWNQNRGPDVPDGPILQQPLHAEFPANLVIDILAPPADDGFFSIPGEDVEIAEGYLHVDDPQGQPIGAAIDVVVVYVRGTVEEGSLTALYLGGVRVPGYHLLAWQATSGLSAAQQALADACAETASVEACSEPRRYRLADSAADLDSPVTFFRRDGL